MSSLKKYICKLIGFSLIVSSPFLSVDNAFGHEVEVFWSPQIDGLKIDRCIQSYQYPDGCSANASQFAAHQFCKLKGYSNAFTWEWVDDPNQIRLYKLLDEPGSTQFRVAYGGYVFTGIACQR